MAESYLAQGQEEVWFVEAGDLSSAAAPTKTEIEGGIAFGRHARTFSPPSTQGNSVDATPMGAKNASSLDGLPGITNASATFLIGDDADADTVELFGDFTDLLKESGYLVVAPRGRVGVDDDDDGAVTSGDLVHVYPAKVNTVSIDSNGPQDPKTFTVSFTHAGAWYPAVTVAAS